jgi:hypothetical protein
VTRTGHESRVRNLWLTIGFTFAGLALFGVKANFFQSDRWLDISVYVVITLTLVLTVLTVLTARGTNFGYPDIRSKAVRISLGVVILPTFAALMSWMAISVAIPSIITRFAGSQFAETHELSKQFVDSHRGCDYRVFGSPFSQNYYCADPDEFARLPARGRMRIHGRQSWFGSHIYFVEPDPAFHR